MRQPHARLSSRFRHWERSSARIFALTVLHYNNHKQHDSGTDEGDEGYTPTRLEQFLYDGHAAINESTALWPV